jgi:predicted permease
MPEWTAELRARLAPLALAPAREAEIIEELSIHLDERYRELCLTHPPERARELALTDLEDQPALARRMGMLRQARAAHALLPPAGAPGRRRLAGLAQDLRYAVRMLRRQPGLAAAAIVTLGLGIGANTAIFSLVHAALLRPLPVHGLDTLYLVHNGRPGGVFSYPDYADLRDRNDVFTEFIAWGGILASLNADAESDQITGAIVTGSFFPTLGISASRGRLLGPHDDATPMGHPVAVISDALWHSRFGGREDIVGHDIVLNGHRFTIVGVTPPGFTGLQAGLVRNLYVPMMMQPLMRPPRAGYSGERDPDLLRVRGNSWLFAVGRLKPGVSTAQAEASLSALATAIAGEQRQRAAAAATPARPPQRRVPISPLALGDAAQRASLVSVAKLLTTVVGLVLLIACANIANLLLSRAVARQPEIALRLALGADRGRLVRQLLTESVLLAVIGGAAGVGVAWLIASAFGAAPPPPGALPIGLAFPLDLPVLAFALGLSVLTGIVFGLAPALTSSRPGLVPALKGGSMVPPHRWRPRRLHMRSALVVSQVALSIALLVAAGLFVRSLQRAQQIDPGFEVDRLLTVPLNVNLLRYTTTQGREFYARVVESVNAIPGVESAAVSRIGLLPGGGRTLSIVMEGQESTARAFQSEGTAVAISTDVVAANVIGPEYFRTLALPATRGRDFGPEDTPTSPPVAIVNETFVAHRLGGREPVGHRFRPVGAQTPWITIVGLVPDTKYATLSEGATPVVYFPLSQNHETGMTLIVRAANDPARLAAPVRAAIRGLEPNLPFTGARSGADILGANLYSARMGAVLIGSFALLALLLAAVGVYGVLAFSTSRRQREMGIRLALGAAPRRVFLMVVREGLLLVAVGAAIGIGAAYAGSQLIAGFLYGVSARDAATFVSVPALLALAALAACAIPARRAMQVDPVTALRSE